MILLCFKNGSLTREWVRDQIHSGKDWAVFDQHLLATKPGNGGNIGYYFLQPEIVPTLNHRAMYLSE